MVKRNNRVEKKKEKTSGINKIDLKNILICFLGSRILLIIFLIFKNGDILELYDCAHYIEIAKMGYAVESKYAFFPLYPIMIRIFSLIIPSYKISGMLISNICSFLSILIIFELIKEKDKLGNIMCFIFSPILAYSSIVYTESLFMFLTLLGFYLYKNDKYKLSGVVVGLSMLTRNSGIILWGAIGLDMLYRLKLSEVKFKNILYFGFISLIIGMIYPIYLYIETGDFFRFVSIQMEYWGRIRGTPIGNFLNDILVLKNDGKFLIINLIIFFENWCSFIFALILGIKIFKKDRVSSIYIIVSLIAFTITYRDPDYWMTLSSVSLFRFVLNLFPIYLYLFYNKKENVKLIIGAIFVFVSIFNTVLIYSGSFLG